LISEEKSKFYSVGFVLGILSLCIPMYGLLLGIIGLPLAFISKRKSSVILNSVGIALQLIAVVLLFLFSL